ncbi:MAG: hypothetical protein IT378_06980 [Sandaracinaceae bacterium]|nr:hypothetical protein [Sandaracinaceae bacterium]
MTVKLAHLLRSRRSMVRAVPAWARFGTIGRLCPAALLAVACGGAGSPFASNDGGAGVPGDGSAGFTDAGAGHPDAGFDPAFDAGASPARNEADLGAIACFNGEDDDSNGDRDCADTSCGAVGSCCFGSGSPGCCVSDATPVSVDFATCAGTLAECLGVSASLFGPALPVVEDGAFIANGDESFDGSALIGPALDATSQRIVLRASLAAPLGGCGVACLSSVGLGVTSAADPSTVGWSPEVAVVVSGSRGDFALVVAGLEVQRFRLPTDAPAEYTLELDPTGRVSLSLDGARVASDVPFAPRSGARVVLFGRAHNRPADAALPARALAISVATEICEMPAALTREGAPLLPDALEAPAAIELEGQAVVAAVSQGGIYLWRQQGAGYAPWPTDDARLEPAGDVLAYGSPSLVQDPETLWIFAQERGLGARWVRATLSAAGDVGPLEALAGTEGIEEAGLAYVRGAYWLVGRMGTGAESRIVWLVSTDGVAFAPGRGDLDASTIARPRLNEVAAFDRDEVGAPALVVDGRGIVRAYYAGRRGTRWSIGMRAADYDSFRDEAFEVLGPSGSGHDALGARAPSPLVREGELHLFYEAWDGARARLGHAVGATR